MDPLNNEVGQFNDKDGFRSWSINSIDFGNKQQIEDTEKKFDEVLYKKGFLLKGIHVKNYNFTIPEDITNYEKDYAEVLSGQYIGTHFMLGKEKKFVDSVVGWLVNMEWVEFEIKTEAQPNIATASENKG